MKMSFILFPLLPDCSPYSNTVHCSALSIDAQPSNFSWLPFKNSMCATILCIPDRTTLLMVATRGLEEYDCLIGIIDTCVV